MKLVLTVLLMLLVSVVTAEDCRYNFEVRTGELHGNSEDVKLRLYSTSGEIVVIDNFGRPAASWNTDSVDTFYHTRSCVSNIVAAKLFLTYSRSGWSFEALKLTITKDADDGEVLASLFGYGNEFGTETIFESGVAFQSFGLIAAPATVAAIAM